MKKNRGNDPKALTIYMLCANSAGMCEFEGCSKNVFIDSITLKNFNNSNVAHIVASSPDGPRGDETRSYELSDKLENLMLVCQEHHTLIDRFPEEYTEAKLLEMKKKHEEQIEFLCKLKNNPKTERVFFSSPIKGEKEVKIDEELTVKAILPNKIPAAKKGIIININSFYEYCSDKYWEDVDKQLCAQFDRKIKNDFIDTHQAPHFSVFPLAPIPLIIKLGYLFSDKLNLDIFQKTRNPDTWNWINTYPQNSFIINKQKIKTGNKVALIISITADVNINRILKVYDADIVYTIKANKIGTDSITSLAELSLFWHKYQEVCDDIKNSDINVNEISLFPAIPNSVAFEIGRRYMPKVYPKILIYDNRDEFCKAISIGG